MKRLHSYLFKNKHGVVEELLQFLVGVVDAHLLERVELQIKKEFWTWKKILPCLRKACEFEFVQAHSAHARYLHRNTKKWFPQTSCTCYKQVLNLGIGTNSQPGIIKNTDNHSHQHWHRPSLTLLNDAKQHLNYTHARTHARTQTHTHVHTHTRERERERERERDRERERERERERVLNAKLHHTLKISNPAISSMPMKELPFREVRSKVLLIRATSHLNMRSYRALPRASRENRTWLRTSTNARRCKLRHCIFTQESHNMYLIAAHTWTPETLTIL